MTAPIAFLDTETTSLRPDRRAWEIGIVRREDGRQEERVWFVDADDLDLGNADPFALKIGRYYERHPDAIDGVEYGKGYPGSEQYGPESWVMRDVAQWTRGAHLVGAVVSFDAEVLAARMRANGVLPGWHHHLIDVEALALGFLCGKASEGDLDAGLNLPDLPWKSDDLAKACGVEPASDDERHTALGDTRWVMRWYDAITGGAA